MTDPQFTDTQPETEIKPILFYFSIYFTAITLVFTFLAYSHLTSKRNSTIFEHKFQAKSQLEYQAGLMRDHFNDIKSDILFLPRLNEMLKYKQLNKEEDRQLIEREFLEFTVSKKVYDQIRYINGEGQELCRINNNNGGFPTAVAKGDLQNKASRYYFTESAKIKRGEIYISPFDLNKENGRIEIPLKPMIRFGTPVMDNKGKIKGVVVLNYLGNFIIEDLKTASNNEPGSYSLMNLDGHWLFNNNPDDEWGFMFEHKKNFTMRNRDPELWKKISSKTFHQEHTSSHLYTSTIVTPFKELRGNDLRRSWILLSAISNEEMGVELLQLYKTLKNIILYFLILIVTVAYLLARATVQKKKYQNALTRAALYDGLTRLTNRKLFMDRLEQTLEASRRYDHKIGILFIDLDGFKAVNDKMGHKAGDELLRKVGVRLQNTVRKTDTVSRFGGDEFVILLPQIEDDENCNIIAEKVCATISKPFMLSNKEASIGASVGIVVCNSTVTCTPDSLIQKADGAMYDVKESGKGSFKRSTAEC